jgi:hypothetical protein
MENSYLQNHRNVQMKKQDDYKNLLDLQEGKDESVPMPGYPLYPASEDIYNKYVKGEGTDVPDIDQMDNMQETESDRKDNAGQLAGEELDIPGSELDDLQEDIGSEDEENNYYSIGGDNHDDLEEDRQG